MKSRLATSIRSGFLCMNLRGRIPVSTLLVVIVTAAAWAQSAPAVSSAEARKAIQARVAMDKNTIERMLAPDLYVQTPDRKLTPTDPPRVRGTGPATVVGGDSADRKRVMEFSSDVLCRSRQRAERKRPH